jgi:single-strand DNA-binding protein
MSSGNFVNVVGNATRDPELRFTASGQATCSFGLAVNRRWQNKQTQEWEEAVSFFDVVCWRDMAENAADSVTKGMRVMVTGRLEQRTWEDKETGGNRSKVEIVADEVGPSLRWASAQVEKNQRDDKSGGGGGQQQQERQPVGAGARSQRQAAPSAPDASWDEEPW